MSLAPRAWLDYAFSVPAKSGAGFSSLNTSGRTAPDRRFFMSGQIINGGLCGEAERLAGVLEGRSANPAHVRHPRLAANGELLTLRSPYMNRITPRNNQSLVLNFSGTPIRFMTDKAGRWMVDFQAISTALGYQGDAYTASRMRLKNTVSPSDYKLNHSVHGDLVSLPGLDRVLARIELGRDFDRPRADLATALRLWLTEVPAQLEQISSIANPSISTEKHTGLRGLYKNARFGEIGSTPSQARIEESHSDNSCDCDVRIGISPSPAAGMNSANLAVLQDLADPATAFVESSIFNIWYGILGDQAYTAKEVIERTAANPHLTAALLDVAYNRKDRDSVCPRRLGIWLAKHAGWTNGFLRVGPPNYDTNRHIRLWSVRKVAP